MKGRHTGESISIEYENILDDYGIDANVFKAVDQIWSKLLKSPLLS